MRRKSRRLISTGGSIFLLLGAAAFGFLICAAQAAESNPSPRKSTNVTVDSTQLEPFSINEKTEPKDKGSVFYSDKNSSVDINENGEPDLNMRF